jgi:uncharacterized protein with NAD-binding domain and iron-sulfur cluster
VYERKALVGKARSIPVPNSGATPLPAEHGFRFFPGFYRNVTDTMRRIPFSGNTNGVWQNLTRATSYLHSGLGRADLTIPLPFPLPTVPNPITPKAFIESVTTVFQTLFRLPLWEAAYAAQKLAVYVTSCTERRTTSERTKDQPSTTGTSPTGSFATWPHRNPKTPARIRSAWWERRLSGRSCCSATTATARASTECSTGRRALSG